MGVLSLHNECPPFRLGPETADICDGMILGEEGTSALLTSLSDCLTALAAMDDAVGSVLHTWAGVARGEASPNGDAAAAVRDAYSRSFGALTETIDRIDVSLERYAALKEYGRAAAAAGRGREFNAGLRESAGCGFTELVNRRVDGLRRLKVRVKLLRRLEAHGIQILTENNFPEFFLMFMQPIRDVAIAVEELYGEVVRGALASHQTLFRVCELLDEGSTLHTSVTGDDLAAVTG